MLKIIAVIACALLVNSRQEVGDSLMGFLPKFKSPAEVGQMVKEWKQGGKEDEKVSKDERTRLQSERDVQKQEAVFRRQEQRKAEALALQERIEARKRQQDELRANGGHEHVAPRHDVVAPVRQVARVQSVQESPRAFAKIRDIEDESDQPMRLAAAPVAVYCRHNVGGMIDLNGNLRCN
jgi:hypothetical protein